MKVSGFTFIRNAITYDYPVEEAIKSILPICDEFIVAVGNSSDDTHSKIEQIAPDKIKIIDTIWDDSLREGGRVLAVETDKAFAAISEDTDWCFYIQGDEVVHEKYLDTIYQAMQKTKDRKDIDGLLFKYLHFYGSYDFVGASSKWYKHEIRVIKNNPKIYSYRDAQGFRKNEDEKLNVIPIDAYIYHYGWVKDPRKMQKKQETFHKYWHDDRWIDQNVVKSSAFDYEMHVKELKRFEGSHPRVMLDRINQKNWQFDYDISINQKSLKDRIKNLMSRFFGVELGYKNYILKR
ncbi:MAG: hypothetical protein JXR60_11385 [Bacteroidales bacterium]|nr:hypothetical protein [Bacteroidales bacterium]